MVDVVIVEQHGFYKIAKFRVRNRSQIEGKFIQQDEVVRLLNLSLKVVICDEDEYIMVRNYDIAEVMCR